MNLQEEIAKMTIAHLTRMNDAQLEHQKQVNALALETMPIRLLPIERKT